MRYFLHFLAKLRFLRGTFLDPFGYMEERRQEREDIEKYVRLLRNISNNLTNENYQSAIALATLPAKLRGFGYVKQESRILLDQRREHLLKSFLGQEPAEEIKFSSAA